jgi:hypothetical protein
MSAQSSSALATTHHSPPPRQANHVIILVHGIRDFALWQEVVGKSLTQNGLQIAATNYGRFDLIRFLVPIQYFRRKAIDEVLKQIRIAKETSGAEEMSIIAHSFGTYVVSHILKENFDLKFRRIIFCGSVVQYSFPFEQFYHRFRPPILNEVGTQDVWPAMAESVTWGYGSAGTYGFRRPLVKDRWHNDAGHGYFLTSEFCNKYWLPYLTEGRVVPASDKPNRPGLWVQLLSIFRLKYVLLIAGALGLALASTPTMVKGTRAVFAEDANVAILKKFFLDASPSDKTIVLEFLNTKGLDNTSWALFLRDARYTDQRAALVKLLKSANKL